jgi:hypothetical protein
MSKRRKNACPHPVEMARQPYRDASHYVCSMPGCGAHVPDPLKALMEEKS